MIARLKGLLDAKYDDSLILDVNGVGYKVFVSSKTLNSISLGDAVALDIETVIREDSFNLFGFLSPVDKQWFEVLTSVQGVGAKVALAIQSIMGTDELYVAVGASDKTAFGRASGVGPKLAGRIVLELKDKVSKMKISAVSVEQFTQSIDAAANSDVSIPNDVAVSAMPTANVMNGAIMEDAISALVNLGFNRSLAFSAVSKSMEKIQGDVTVTSIIPLALKELNG